MADAANAARAARHPWPFRAPPTHHDSQVSEQGVGVPARHEIQFKDGSTVWLRRVILNGAPDLFLRDLGEPLEGKRIDLRKLIPDVEKELPTTSTRDVAGYVSISLRLKFATLDAFLAAVEGNA
jgi:hypothetical protein